MLFFYSYSWVVTTHMGWDLIGFQYQVERILTKRLPLQSLNVKWEKNLAEAETSEAGFETMEICRIQSNSIFQCD